MKRREPPLLATWMLEHLTSGNRDEALAGDLLEEFREGRSGSWYWHQVVTACVVSWGRSLGARVPLLLFALLWSIPAPAWRVFCGQILNHKVLNDTWQMLGGLWLLPALAVWVIVHTTFLWAGIFVYILFHSTFGNTLHKNKIRRALLLAPLIFAPVFGTMFVLLNLYWFSLPGLAGEKLASTLFGQVADLRILADFVRVPYFIALLSALWGAIPRVTRTSFALPVSSAPVESSFLSETVVSATTPGSFNVKLFFGLLVTAGLMNAMLVSILLCRLPASHTPTLASVLVRAIGYLAAGVLAGAGGTWIYWRSPANPFRERPPFSFPLFALVCACGWVWVPSMVIFSEQLSAAAYFVAMIATFVLASGLRTATYTVFAPAQLRCHPSEVDDELFAESLYRPPFEIHGYVVAICLYAAGIALLARFIYSGTALLALSTFLFAWKKTIPETQSIESAHGYRNSVLRLTGLLLPAVVVTAWALLDGVAHRNRIAEADAAFSASRKNGTNTGADRKSILQSTAYGHGGYVSVILWPYPEKKQIVAFPAEENPLLAPGTTRPLIIRFNGPYRYMQSSRKLSGAVAHQAHGTPLSIDIESNNSIPLVMDAHQNLSAAIRIVRCREIQVEIANMENRSGRISLALLLTNGMSPHGQTLYLDQQPIVSTEPGHFSFKSKPVFETLHFPVAMNSKMQKFSEMTVVFLPDIEHQFVAPKIALQQFKLLPR